LSAIAPDDDQLEMTEPEPSCRYTIRVARRGETYVLRIPELFLAVSATELRAGYVRLLERRREMLDLARMMGVMDELPPPATPPALTCRLTLTGEVDREVVPIEAV
jgi:hypothetical protein